uniref:DAP3 binding cell death enhancer 1 n=1 Tax=Lates calcarifer TaxID=8187 RepID=A0A4W6C3M8_LATCA
MNRISQDNRKKAICLKQCFSDALIQQTGNRNRHVTVRFTLCCFSLSTQKEQDGERRRRQRTFQFGWPSHDTDVSPQGAAAVLFMQICRRIHSQFSSGTEPSPTPGALTAPGSLQKCGYRILLEILSRRNVLPRGGSVLCLQGVPERQNQDQTETQSSSSSTAGDAALHSSSEHLTADSSISDHQRAHLNQDLPTLGLSVLNKSNIQNKIANIFTSLFMAGIESAKSEDYKEAFTCFLAAAQQGYSKAQFNVGVCYEKGRGVGKDREKALYYYQQAATGGHAQAQYRYAKLLLTSGGQQSLEVLDTVIDLLQQAAAAGLTKAQVCLASVYSQESVRDWSKSVQYLKMAAESGDDAALLFLGQCYESGLGVQQNLRIAIEFYRRAAQAGNRQAKTQDAVLRSIRSDPCFFLANRQLQQPPSSLAGRAHPSPGHPTTLPLLPHSWSTGNLGAPSPLSPTPLHLLPHGAEGGTCRWTVGIG